MTGYFLIKGNDPKGSERVELSAETLVGRSDDCDLKVTEGHPSRRHAMLTVDALGAWIEDLGSANGTFVNQQPITERTQLTNGDLVAFDQATYVVAAPVVDTGDATVVRRPPVANDATVVRSIPKEPAPAPPVAVPEPVTPPPVAAATPEPTPVPAAAERAPEPVAQNPPPEPKPAPEPQAAPEPAPAAPAPPAPAPPAPAPAAAGGKPVPRSWADPEYQGEGTRILKPEELRAMAAGAAAAGANAPATNVQSPHLVVINGNSAGTVLQFQDSKTEWSVGTDPGHDLQLSDNGVSAFHAKISHENGRWKIIDQMSANHTFVNGQQSTVSFMQNGDHVRFAHVECEIRLPAGGGKKAAKSKRPAKAKKANKKGMNTWLIVAIATAITVGGLFLASQYLL